MDPLSAALMLKSLDGLSARQVAISENIANSQSAGYRPLQVSFEAALKSAEGGGVSAVRQVQPSVQRMPVAPGENGVRLDQELAAASATAARYGALIDVLDRSLQLESVAVTGGR